MNGTPCRTNREVVSWTPAWKHENSWSVNYAGLSRIKPNLAECLNRVLYFPPSEHDSVLTTLCTFVLLLFFSVKMSVHALHCEIMILISAVLLKLMFWEPYKNYQSILQMWDGMAVDCNFTCEYKFYLI